MSMKRKGIILASVLWMMILLSMMVFFISRQTHLNLRYTKVKKQYELSEPLLRSAYFYVEAILQNDATPATDSANDEFYDNPGLFKEGECKEINLPFSIQYQSQDHLKYRQY